VKLTDDELVRTLFVVRLATIGLSLDPDGFTCRCNKTGKAVARFVGWARCGDGFDAKMELLEPVQTMHLSTEIDAHELGNVLPIDWDLNTVH
jgi:hypothetical protein